MSKFKTPEDAIVAAIKASQKRVALLSTKKRNEHLEMFCGDFAEAYEVGVEEAQREISMRLSLLLAECKAASK